MTTEESDNYKSLTEIASELVFSLLLKQKSLSEETKKRLELKTLEITDETVEMAIRGSLDLLRPVLLAAIIEVYRGIDSDMALAVARKAAEQIMAVVAKRGSETDPGLIEAFTNSEYLGTAADELADYLRRCWGAYTLDSCSYKAPYVTVVQSSGFGKSRLVFQLAQNTAAKDALNMRVLYTCVRLGMSRGFPKTTTELRIWLFDGGDEDEHAMAQHLVAIYDYAHTNWSRVGTDWLELFTSPEADTVVQKQLADTEARGNSVITSAWSPEKRPRREGKLVILVVDEASALFQIFRARGLNAFGLLRRALVIANDTIRTGGYNGGIFCDIGGYKPEGVGLDAPFRVRPLV
ncbi:hypothetical protein PHYBOEH_009086 [Phytophthora boehmeriae]|uniref:Uncharacterized protein n=1 Tax=Phytophthora boehmeriae TaxID=109152 RepID=A0A8T1VVN5_9STRA|nr:hypothetical protein PHYBOEH_009086 [Phytophthora boehmeriae]